MFTPIICSIQSQINLETHGPARRDDHVRAHRRGGELLRGRTGAEADPVGREQAGESARGSPERRPTRHTARESVRQIESQPAGGLQAGGLSHPAGPPGDRGQRGPGSRAARGPSLSRRAGRVRRVGGRPEGPRDGPLLPPDAAPPRAADRRRRQAGGRVLELRLGEQEEAERGCPTATAADRVSAGCHHAGRVGVGESSFRYRPRPAFGIFLAGHAVSGFHPSATTRTP